MHAPRLFDRDNQKNTKKYYVYAMIWIPAYAASSVNVAAIILVYVSKFRFDSQYSDVLALPKN